MKKRENTHFLPLSARSPCQLKKMYNHTVTQHTERFKTSLFAYSEAAEAADDDRERADVA